MPIPNFDHNGVLPPHLGNPTTPAQISPYPSTPIEICERFGFSPERRQILRGWLELRTALRALGYSAGFQWLDGSFMEDSEQFRGRPPGDIDVVSFLAPSSIAPNAMDLGLLTAVANHDRSKMQFHVDHFIVGLNWPGYSVVEWTRYWCGLFSHRKSDAVWKGMLKVDLNTQADDAAALKRLDELGNP